MFQKQLESFKADVREVTRLYRELKAGRFVETAKVGHVRPLVPYQGQLPLA